MDLNFLPSGQGLAIWRRGRTIRWAVLLALVVSVLGWGHRQWVDGERRHRAAEAWAERSDREAADRQRLEAAQREQAARAAHEQLARQQARLLQAREAAGRLAAWAAQLPSGLQVRQLEWEPGRLRLIGWALSEAIAHDGLRRGRGIAGFPQGLEAVQIAQDGEGRVRFEWILSSPASASAATPSRPAGAASGRP